MIEYNVIYKDKKTGKIIDYAEDIVFNDNLLEAGVHFVKDSGFIDDFFGGSEDLMFSNLPGGTQVSNISELQGNTTFEKILDFMSREERGKPWSAPFSGHDFGIKLKGESHVTYGCGQVYDSNGQLWENKPKDQITEQNLRDDFIKQVQKEYKIVTQGLNLSIGQTCAMCHRYHFGPAYALKFRDWMKANGVPNASGFFNWWINLQRGFKNWSIYAKGWTNGLARETQLWQQ